MKKCLVAGLIISAMVSLTGCGEPAPRLSAEQQFELTKLRIEADKEKFIASQQAEIADDKYDAEVAQYEANTSDYYEPQQQREDVYSEDGSYNTTSTPEPVNTDSGIDGGSLLLGAATGGLAGYAAGAILNSGHTEYTDSKGNKQYVDKKGNRLSASQYDNWKKQNPKLAKAREVATTGQSKAGTAVQTAKGKVVDTSKRVANSAPIQTAKGKITNGYTKAVNSKSGHSIQQAAKKGKEKAKKAASVVRQSYKKSRRKGK
jgi:hypothetical protein